MEQDGLLVGIDHLPSHLWGGCAGRTAEAHPETRTSELTFHPHPFGGYDGARVDPLRSIRSHLQCLSTIVFQCFHLSPVIKPLESTLSMALYFFPVSSLISRWASSLSGLPFSKKSEAFLKWRRALSFSLLSLKCFPK
jgi:hypothetical protein